MFYREPLRPKVRLFKQGNQRDLKSRAASLNQLDKKFPCLCSFIPQ